MKPSDEINEGWLREVGFKWHQLDRQPDKHWLLWLGDAVGDRITSFEDLGVEVAPTRDGEWFVWLRADTAGRYTRFLHVRLMCRQAELIALVEAITGRDWAPENHMYGSARTPDQAARIRVRETHLDHAVRRTSSHTLHELDESGGRSLPEHLAAHERAKRSTGQ